MKKLLLITTLLVTPLDASIFGSSKVRTLKEAITALKNDHRGSLAKIIELQDVIKELSAQQSNLIANAEALKKENVILQAILGEYRDNFDGAIMDLIDITNALTDTKEDLVEAAITLDAMMDIPADILKEGNT